MTTTESFHAHLDKCEQCRNNPLGNCPEFNALLIGAASGVTVKDSVTEKMSEVQHNRFKNGRWNLN